MKLLLDENQPKRLKSSLSDHVVFTVRDMGWNGRKNGELLALMQNEGFDALLTFDRNLRYQQNFQRYELPVVVLNAPDNTFNTLQKMVPEILALMKKGLSPGPIELRLG